MKVSQVKTHTKRSKTGKIFRIGTHSRSTTKGTKSSISDKLREKVFEAIENQAHADELIRKYAKYPTNLEVMVDGNWKDVKVKRWETVKNPETKHLERKQVVKNERQLNLKPEQWNKIFRENSGMVRKHIERWNFKEALIDDLKQVAHKAIFDGLNNYESKFNPSNPVDLSKHLFSYIAGAVQGEIARHLATTVKLPYNKSVIYTKYKDLYEKHDGDWDKIYDDLKLKKKNLRPDLVNKNPDEAEEILPKEGYVTIKGESALKNKTEKYEKSVNSINSDRTRELEMLETRHKQGEEDMLEYQQSIKLVDKELEGIKAKIKSQEAQIRDGFDEMKNLKGDSKGEYFRGNVKPLMEKKEKLERDYETLNKKKDKYVATVEPLSDEDYEKQKNTINQNYDEKLRKRKEKFDEETGRSVIAGAYQLFREFDEYGSYKEYNLSSPTDYGEGEKGTLEDIIQSPEGERVSPLGQILVKEKYKINLDKLNEGIDMLEDRTAMILRMHLGLDKKNELYPHGLWGKPMTVSEIAYSIPDNTFPRIEAIKHGVVKVDVGTPEYKQAVEKWNAKKPKEVQKVKDKDYDKKISKWEKDREKSLVEIREWMGKNPNRTKEETSKIRESVYNKNKAGVKDKPTKFIEEKISPLEYKEQLKVWKSKEPKKELKKDAIIKRINQELDVAKVAIRRLVPKNVVDELIDAYRDMRKYNIKKASIKDDLRKSLIFDSFFGYTYAKDKEENIIIKSLKKLGRLFKQYT